ncbi:YkvA family protein [Clostridium ganghwense]|uniref:DUF1232 domain-containing protein n=1 Tax=Clostridium ganghwense TaxID=312089 RepID=A0ABT4CPG7_9CLOT|nr:DUF1232 domain-containing protein [Clostridium ganghwense]MCY6370954.1 DUF1232 domain-containing protein [Clostridium ganghwense]
MNISDIRVKLTEKDLLGMIAENVQVDGLKIEKIEINELLKVEGYYTKGLRIGFSAALGFGSVENNILKFRLFNLKVAKIPIWVKIVNFALKKLLKNFKSMGISIEKDTIYLNFTLLSKYIPAVEFTIRSITALKGELEVEIENLIYSEAKKAVSLDELKDKISKNAEGRGQENSNDESKNSCDKEVSGKSEIMIVNKTEDTYSKIREEVEDKFPEEYKDFAKYAMLIPDIIVLLYRLMKDNRIKPKTKALIGAAVGYLALPLDILPDSIPIIGQFDDAGIVFFVLDKIIEDIPEYIILEHWQGKDDIITKAREIKEFSYSVIGRKKAISVLSGIFVVSKKVIHRKKKRKRK